MGFEKNSLLSQSVDLGRFYFFVAVSSKKIRSQRIGSDQKDIGVRGGLYFERPAFGKNAWIAPAGPIKPTIAHGTGMGRKIERYFLSDKITQTDFLIDPSPVLIAILWIDVS